MTTQIQRNTAHLTPASIFYLDTLDKLPAILCLHGKWGRCETWRELMLRYRGQFRVIAPDQRGHGFSSAPVAPYSGDDMAEDMHRLIQHLKCGPVIAIGHSMGGRNAAYLAARYPEDVTALAILDIPAKGPKTPFPTDPTQIQPGDKLTNTWDLPYSTRQEAIEDLSRRFARETNVRYFLESLTEKPEGHSFMFSPYAMAALDAYYTDWYHLLPTIKCPVLLARAQDSWCMPQEDASKMKTMLKNCTYVEITNSDHMIYVDNPNEFYPVLDQFLNFNPSE